MCKFCWATINCLSFVTERCPLDFLFLVAKVWWLVGVCLEKRPTWSRCSSQCDSDHPHPPSSSHSSRTTPSHTEQRTVFSTQSRKGCLRSNHTSESVSMLLSWHPDTIAYMYQTKLLSSTNRAQCADLLFCRTDSEAVLLSLASDAHHLLFDICCLLAQFVEDYHTRSCSHANRLLMSYLDKWILHRPSSQYGNYVLERILQSVAEASIHNTRVDLHFFRLGEFFACQDRSVWMCHVPSRLKIQSSRF